VPTTIHLPLLDEGTDVVRPTLGVELGGGLYLVLPTSDYNPADEKWEFPPGSIVKCDIQKRSGGEVLVAKVLCKQ
jgi:hypothetical protein